MSAIPKMKSGAKKSRGRPKGRRFGHTPVMIRMDADTEAALDGWRKLWPDNPTRAEVVRRLVRGEKPPKAAQ
jgi:hypothetical protein